MATAMDAISNLYPFSLLKSPYRPEQELEFIHSISYCMIVTGLLTLVTLQYVNAPYGRYSSAKWGVFIPAKFAWLVQELPSFVAPVFCIYLGSKPNIANRCLLGIFLTHYVQRTFIYPLLIKGGKPTPLIPFLLALVFCLGNGYIQGRNLTKFADYSDGYVLQPKFIVGACLFFIGMAINIHSDHILRNLRKPGDTAYRIPKGGMFEYVSGANFFGEIIEWCGYAIACWNLPALAFAIFTICNIGPRACSHHRMYQQKFDDYPCHRKALIPFII
ncbi:3-oxo-5-alpha-steroid 4-dehydrogenase 1-like [Tubulanus polymorphus]|uniref:3-oxo-5-alpha-steroid 4-dehydrogenase 1-like n=1 Tax=Tubulanus polymorphus TaxID=672921 RepID=UPI003DA4CE90